MDTGLRDVKNSSLTFGDLREFGSAGDLATRSRAASELTHLSDVHFRLLLQKQGRHCLEALDKRFHLGGFAKNLTYRLW